MSISCVGNGVNRSANHLQFITLNFKWANRKTLPQSSLNFKSSLKLLSNSPATYPPYHFKLHLKTCLFFFSPTKKHFLKFKLSCPVADVRYVAYIYFFFGHIWLLLRKKKSHPTAVSLWIHTACSRKGCVTGPCRSQRHLGHLNKCSTTIMTACTQWLTTVRSKPIKTICTLCAV